MALDNFDYETITSIALKGFGCLCLGGLILFFSSGGELERDDLKWLVIGGGLFIVALLMFLLRFFLDRGNKGRVILSLAFIAALGTASYSVMNGLEQSKSERLVGWGLSWKKHFDAGEVGSMLSLDLSSDNNIIFVGRSKKDYDPVSYGKISINGDVLWTKTLDRSLARLNVVKALPEGGSLLGGEVWDGDANGGVVIRIDSQGEILWKQNYGINKYTEINAIELLKNGQIVIAGVDSEELTGGNHQAYLAMLDTSGTLIWEDRYEADGNTNFRSVYYNR